MKTEYLISINEFCAGHNVEISFIISLQQSGLIEIIIVEDNSFIHADQLPYLEKFTRFYYEMDINLEGIETIHHLLQQIDAMKEENIALRNRLSFYESGN